MSLIKKMFSSAEAATPIVDEVDYNVLIERGVMLIDVRTQQEYLSHHIPKAVNIPIAEITKQMCRLKESIRPVLVYCKSGQRSQKAVKLMRKNGIECYNGGDLNRVKDQITRHQQGVGF